MTTGVTKCSISSMCVDIGLLSQTVALIITSVPFVLDGRVEVVELALGHMFSVHMVHRSR